MLGFIDELQVRAIRAQREREARGMRRAAEAQGTHRLLRVACAVRLARLAIWVDRDAARPGSGERAARRSRTAPASSGIRYGRFEPMSLKHVLLGFLSYGPMTGYELKKFFDTSVAHFWNAELSQIYPSLKQLESEGLVEMEVEVQADRPNRKVYFITEDGSRDFMEWLALPAETNQARDPLLIKVFFGVALPKQQLIGVLRHRADELRLEIEDHERGHALIQQFADSLGLQREAFFWGLTVECGVKEHQALIDWTEEAIRKVEQLEDSSFVAGRPGAATFDVRSALKILAELKTAMGETFVVAPTASER